jgi:hypothetical protein
LLEVEELVTMELRRNHRASRGQWAMLYGTASPLQKMPLLAIQEALRMGNSHPKLPDPSRVVTFVHAETDSPTGVTNYFSKLHKDDIVGLAASLKDSIVEEVDLARKNEM